MGAELPALGRTCREMTAIRGKSGGDQTAEPPVTHRTLPEHDDRVERHHGQRAARDATERLAMMARRSAIPAYASVTS